MISYLCSNFIGSIEKWYFAVHPYNTHFECKLRIRVVISREQKIVKVND